MERADWAMAAVRTCSTLGRWRCSFLLGSRVQGWLFDMHVYRVRWIYWRCWWRPSWATCGPVYNRCTELRCLTTRTRWVVSNRPRRTPLPPPLQPPLWPLRWPSGPHPSGALATPKPHHNRSCLYSCMHICLKSCVWLGRSRWAALNALASTTLGDKFNKYVDGKGGKDRNLIRHHGHVTHGKIKSIWLQIMLQAISHRQAFQLHSSQLMQWLTLVFLEFLLNMSVECWGCFVGETKIEFMTWEFGHKLNWIYDRNDWLGDFAYRLTAFKIRGFCSIQVNSWL